VSSFLEDEACTPGKLDSGKKRNPLAEIENHPLLNSKSKSKSMIQVEKRFCDVGDIEL
jgi:hypothetical protein